MSMPCYPGFEYLTRMAFLTGHVSASSRNDGPSQRLVRAQANGKRRRLRPGHQMVSWFVQSEFYQLITVTFQFRNWTTVSLAQKEGNWIQKLNHWLSQNGRGRNCLGTWTATSPPVTSTRGSSSSGILQFYWHATLNLSAWVHVFTICFF
jgi:hypothetical protein